MAGLCVLSSSSAGSQNRVDLRGVVTDTANLPIFGATVSVAGEPSSFITNELGEFRIRNVAPGTVQIRARRLGFVPSELQLDLDAQKSAPTVRFRLSALPSNAPTVVVTASRARYPSRLAGFYDRLRKRSGGQFVERRDIDQQNSRSLTQLLSGLPGVNSVQFRNGGSAVRLRGRACRPLVWLDGVPMPAGEVDLDAFPANTLQGVELYLGSTSAPPDFSGAQGSSNCGTILLWSRGRDTELPKDSKPRTVDIEQLAASLAIFTSDQVDAQAKLEKPSPLQVVYPPSLFAARVPGTVAAEFVVGTDGQIEEGTFAIVSSSDILFSDAVARGLRGVEYSPAQRHGIAVRQVVQLRFSFDPSGEG